MDTFRVLANIRRDVVIGDFWALYAWLRALIDNEANGTGIRVRAQKDIDELVAVKDIDEKIRIANEKITWYDKVITQQQMAGRVIDYTAMKPGDETPTGEIVRICPKCGRAGLVHDGEPNCYHMTTHKVKIGGGMMSELLDDCELDSGLPWNR